MALDNLDLELATNALIQDLKWDAALRSRFEADAEAVLTEYDLTEAECRAWREQDFGQLYRLGAHPYLLSQLARLFIGTNEKAGSSTAATALLKSLWGDEYDAYMKSREQR